VEAAGQYAVCVEGRPRLGTSGIVCATDGLVVTAHHVLGRDEQIAVGLPDGKTVPATLVGREPATDLALVRAQTGSLTPAAWSEATTVHVGHLVLAVARPGWSVQVSCTRRA
jgi:S1-C subfamily serine protease